MNFAIIVGSHRNNSQSTKVAKYMRAQLKTLNKGATVTIIDLAENPLPLWDESAWNPKGVVARAFKPYATKLRKADAFVIISPEWGGMVPAGLKNFFLLAGNQELGHKPAMIVGVSAGRNGHYPISELRMSSFKNNHLCYTPDHIVIQGVEKVLNTNKINEEDKADAYIKKRIIYALGILDDYAKAFQAIRKSKRIDFKTYPYGM